MRLVCCETWSCGPWEFDANATFANALECVLMTGRLEYVCSEYFAMLAKQKQQHEESQGWARFAAGLERQHANRA